MFIFTARFSKKRFVLILLLAAVTAIAILAAARCGQNGTEDIPQLSGNAERVEYLRTWGWEVEPEPLETFQLLLPKPLSKQYADYNDLQQSQGFDLTECCGKQVTRYTYSVTNYPDRADGVQVNLYVCEGAPVAGDVIASGTDGFQAGLRCPQSGK